jgi:hypothetical protein
MSPRLAKSLKSDATPPDTQNRAMGRRRTARMSGGGVVMIPRGAKRARKPIPKMRKRRLPVYRNVSLRSYSVFVAQDGRACRCQFVGIVYSKKIK